MVVGRCFYCDKFVVPESPLSTVAVLQGLGARASLKECILSNNGASGIWVLGAASATLVRCTVQDNQCNGAACWDAGSRLVARGCGLTGNHMNGVRVLHAARAALGDCTLQGNGDHALEAGCHALVEAKRCHLAGVLR
jgi:parallel beta-helix repeat protein